MPRSPRLLTLSNVRLVFAMVLALLVLAPTLPAGAATATSSKTYTKVSKTDTTPPSISITAPMAGDELSGAFTVKGTAKDNDRLASTDVRVGVGDFIAVAVSKKGNWSLNVSALPAGSLDLTARAVDRSGNSASHTITVTVTSADTPPPLPKVGPANNPYPLPSSYVTVNVGDSLQNHSNAHAPGTAFLIKSGIHREQQLQPKAGQVFVGEPGAVLNGARLLTNFTREGDFWVASGQTQEFPQAGECVSGYSGCRYPENLYLDDQMLWQVTTKADVRTGSWFFDYAADKIYFADNPSGRKVEASSTRFAFYGNAENVIIRGLTIEKYANTAQGASVGMGGTGWTIEYNEVRLNHGVGIALSDYATVQNNYVHHQGQIGIAGGGLRARVANNEISHNNTAGFNMLWEAGGTKFVGTTDLLVYGNYSHSNRGPGLWTDWDNVNTLYELNTVADNHGAGIFDECNRGTTIRYNIADRNGSVHLGAGILTTSSRDVTIHNNTVRGNKDGINSRQESRGSGKYGPHLVQNLHVYDNYIEMSGTGFSGIVQSVGNNDVFSLSANNRFFNNDYKLYNVSKPHAWMNSTRTPTEWRGYGHDLTGTWQ